MQSALLRRIIPLGLISGLGIEHLEFLRTPDFHLKNHKQEALIHQPFQHARHCRFRLMKLKIEEVMQVPASSARAAS